MILLLLFPLTLNGEQIVDLSYDYYEDNWAADPPNATIKARIHTKGLDFVRDNLHHVMDREIPKIEFPAITLPIRGGPGKGTVTASGIHVTKLHTPNFDYSISPEGLSVDTRNGTLKIEGLWDAAYTWLIDYSESGWVRALASDIRLRLTTRVYAAEGRPQMEVTACRADIGLLEIEIGGGVLPWIVNLFRSEVSKAVKKIIHNQFCISARGDLLIQANALLRDLPLQVSIGWGLWIDYALVDDPVITHSYIDVDLAGELTYGKINCLSGSNVKKVPTTADSMVSIWVSSQVPNCLLETAHNSKLIDILLTKDVPELSSMLRTSCSMLSICAGRIFPGLRKYPAGFVDVLLHTAKPPTVNLHTNTTPSVDIEFYADILLHPAEENPKVLARLGMSVVALLSPQVSSGRISADVTDVQVNVTQVSSTVGHVSPTLLRLLNTAVRPLLRVAIQTVAKHGLVIPIFDGMIIDDPTTISALVNEAVVELNVRHEEERRVEWSPSSFEPPVQILQRGRKNKPLRHHKSADHL